MLRYLTPSKVHSVAKMLLVSRTQFFGEEIRRNAIDNKPMVKDEVWHVCRHHFGHRCRALYFEVAIRCEEDKLVLLRRFRKRFRISMATILSGHAAGKVGVCA